MASRPASERANQSKLRAEANRAAHERLVVHLVKHGLKRTRQREAILDAFLGARQHVTSEALHGTVRSRNPEIGAATVYRALKLFVEAGVARAHHFRDGITLYEREGQHHDHLICQSCGEIVEFESEAIESEQERVATEYGYRLTHHRHMLYGVCPRCQKAEK